MASKKKLTGAALAESRVLLQKLPDSPYDNYSLAVNYDFDEPNKPDKYRGVEYPDAPENRQAEQGMVRHVIKQLQPANLQSWIQQLVASKGGGRTGSAEAARSLLAMDTPDPTKHQYKAMLRKVEEWGHGTYKTAARGNAHRVGLLRASQAKHLVAHVRGWWEFGETYPAKYTNFKTDPTYPKEVNAILDALRNDGAGFIELVIQSAKDQMEHDSAVPDLVQTHELRLEVNV